MAHKLFIGDLSFSTADERLREVSAQVGPVESAAVVTAKLAGLGGGARTSDGSRGGGGYKRSRW